MTSNGTRLDIELGTTEGREAAIVRAIQNAIGRGAPVSYLDFGTRNDGLGFEFTAYGRIYKVIVIEDDD